MRRAEEEDIIRAISAIIVIIGLVVWWLWPAGTGKKPVTPHKKTAYERQQNEVRPVAMTMIERHLRSPTTADFFNGIPPTAQYVQEDGTWAVIGTVDSQNGFGAMIRTKYAIILKPEPDCADYKSSVCWQIISGPEFTE